MQLLVQRRQPEKPAIVKLALSRRSPGSFMVRGCAPGGDERRPLHHALMLIPPASASSFAFDLRVH
jgi:hypothetical protein